MECLGLELKFCPPESGQSDENNFHSTVVCDFHKGSSFLVYKNSLVREDSNQFSYGKRFSLCVCVGGGGGGYTRTFLKFLQQSIFQAEKLSEKLCQ